MPRATVSQGNSILGMMPVTFLTLSFLIAVLLTGCSRSDLQKVKDDTSAAAQKTTEAAEAAKQAVDANGKARDAAANDKDATKKVGSDIADATRKGLDTAAAKSKELAGDAQSEAKKAAVKAKQSMQDKKDNNKTDQR